MIKVKYISDSGIKQPINLFKINISNGCIIFAILYPVIPNYFDILSLSATNIIYSALTIMALILNKCKIVRPRFITIVIMLWITVLFVNDLHHGYLTEAFWLVAGLLLSGSIFIQNVNNEDIFRKIIFAISYTAGIISIFGLIEAVTKFNVFQLLNTSDGTIYINDLRFGLQRILSFTYQTISYCTYLLMAQSIIFYALTISNVRKQKKIFKIIYVLVFINALLTLSRSALLCMIGLQLILGFVCGYKKLIKKMLVFLIAISIFALVGSLVNDKISNYAINLFYMFLAVFDDKYQSLISTSFGTDNLNAIGNRMDLYTWVWNTIKYDLLWGKGIGGLFNYKYIMTNGQYIWRANKTSIEIQYLYLLFHYGIIGLIMEVATYISLLVYAVSKKFNPATWERKIGFNLVFFFTLIFLLLEYFAISQSSERPMLYLIIMLLIAYNIHNKFTANEK